VIANTGGVLGIGGTPHEVMPRSNKSIVDVDKVPFKGPKTPSAKWHKVCNLVSCAAWCAAVRHLTLKSCVTQLQNAVALCRHMPGASLFYHVQISMHLSA
jgi:hypothetical protein